MELIVIEHAAKYVPARHVHQANKQNVPLVWIVCVFYVYVHTVLFLTPALFMSVGVVKGLCRCRSRHLCGACVQRHCETLGCLQHDSGGAEGGQEDGGDDVVCWECTMFARCRQRRVGDKRVRTKPTEEESEKTKVMCCEGSPPLLRAP